MQAPEATRSVSPRAALATSLRALRDLALLAAAGLAAASIWATGLPEEGLLLDAALWKEEVADARADGPWPRDGWYRLEARDNAVEVRAVRPGDGQAVPDDALFFRLPGTTLKTGLRPTAARTGLLQPLNLDQDYSLTFGRSRVGLRVEAVPKGLQYTVAYAGQTYSYMLAPFDAETTQVRAMADLDGDGLPDFLIDVGGDATYLLLSTHARPGLNRPTAELWAAGC